MEMPMCGRLLLSSLITCHSQLLLKARSSVFMEVSPLQSILSIKSVSSIEFKKFRMRVQSVISYGLTLMTAVDGVFLQEEQVTHLVKIFRSSSIMQMVSS